MLKKQNIIFDIIKVFAEAIANNSYQIIVESANEKNIVGNCKYLLSQFLRQYEIPKSHYFISVKAKEKWQEITDKNIENYSYQDKVICQKDGVEIYQFVGGGNASRKSTLSRGSEFSYRSVFHDEHIVAISDIINELVRLQKCGELNYDAIQQTLDKIYVCRMLKTEDRAIQPKKGRGLDYKKVIETYYKWAGIEVCEWTYKEGDKEIVCLKEKRKSLSKGTNDLLPHKMRKSVFSGKFIAEGELTTLDGKQGYMFYDCLGQEMGIVFMCDDKRSPHFGKCEIHFNDDLQQKIGREWKRFKSNGERIEWILFDKQMKKEKRLEFYVD